MIRGSRTRGASLILALLLLVLVSVVVAAAASRTRRLADGHAAQRARITATHALTGAVEHTRWALARDPSHAGGSVEIGGISVDVDVAGEGAGEGAERRVDAVVRVPRAPASGISVHTVSADLVLRSEGRLPDVTDWRE